MLDVMGLARKFGMLRHRGVPQEELDIQRQAAIIPQYTTVSKGANACSRKVPYNEKWKADRAAKRRSRATGTLISVYRCPVCKKYHLTKANIVGDTHGD